MKNSAGYVCRSTSGPVSARTRGRTSFLVLVGLFLAVYTTGKVVAAPLFDANSVLDVTLTGPIGSLFENKEDRIELPFELQADGVTHNIKVRLRGHSRLEICAFPPLRLNFRKNQKMQTLFDDQDKLKLVTHCRNYDRGEQDLLEEFVAYRIFNVISDKSYRVRLLRINYNDTDEKLDEKASPRYGFLLEPNSQLAERIGANQVELQGIPKQRYDREHAALVFIFQYLIANTDWGYVKADDENNCCHNGDLFEIDQQILFAPYDFDRAGLINARYASPDSSLRIDKVTQRLYRGLCMDQEILRAALQRISKLRPEILLEAQNVPGISDKNKGVATKFLNGFFKQAEREEELLRSFENHCH
jgi:hypothetical protein